jgi:hypothetical protein
VNLISILATCVLKINNPFIRNGVLELIKKKKKIQNGFSLENNLKILCSISPLAIIYFDEV